MNVAPSIEAVEVAVVVEVEVAREDLLNSRSPAKKHTNSSKRHPHRNLL